MPHTKCFGENAQSQRLPQLGRFAHVHRCGVPSFQRHEERERGDFWVRVEGRFRFDFDSSVA